MEIVFKRGGRVRKRGCTKRCLVEWPFVLRPTILNPVGCCLHCYRLYWGFAPMSITKMPIFSAIATDFYYHSNTNILCVQRIPMKRICFRIAVARPEVGFDYFGGWNAYNPGPVLEEARRALEQHPDAIFACSRARVMAKRRIWDGTHSGLTCWHCALSQG